MLLPEKIRKAVLVKDYVQAEEIRLRCGFLPMALVGGKEIEISSEKISEHDLQYIIDRATDVSFHTAIPTLKCGYVCRNGIRIGICGETIMNNGELCGYRHYSSLNIRIPHSCPGIFDMLGDDVFGKGLCSVLIISPPGLGKTTLLREIIKWLSEREFRVGVVDDRNELSAGYCLGKHTDIITMAGKVQGTMIMLRGMNPQIIAYDEISSPEDIQAVAETVGCGVKLLASCHASCFEEMRNRPLYKLLLDLNEFKKIITIKMKNGSRIYELTEI